MVIDGKYSKVHIDFPEFGPHIVSMCNRIIVLDLYIKITLLLIL